jgi:PIN domain nuclease of toxin-antitoxin system
MICLDTHVVVRLYLGQTQALSAAAQDAIEEAARVLVSPAVVLELEFLREIGRLKRPAAEVVRVLERSIGLQVCGISFHEVVEHALTEKWGRDPFDRLIAANAQARKSPLVTKDESIHRHYAQALW